jgi:hypothetical protein
MTAPTLVTRRGTGTVWAGYDFFVNIDGAEFYIAFATKHTTGYAFAVLSHQFTPEAGDVIRTLTAHGASATLTAAEVKDRAALVAGIFTVAAVAEVRPVRRVPVVA